jgi:hypothetical protein
VRQALYHLSYPPAPRGAFCEPAPPGCVRGRCRLCRRRLGLPCSIGRSTPPSPSSKAKRCDGVRRAAAQNNGRGWARTSSLLFVRQALSRLSYSPVGQIRDKALNLDLHVQSVVSCRLDDPGEKPRHSVHLPVPGDRCSRRAPPVGSLLVVLCLAGPKAERCFLCHSPTLRPWIADRCRWSPSYVEEFWSPSLSRCSGKEQAKANANCERLFPGTQR